MQLERIKIKPNHAQLQCADTRKTPNVLVHVSKLLWIICKAAAEVAKLTSENRTAGGIVDCAVSASLRAI